MTWLAENRCETDPEAAGTASDKKCRVRSKSLGLTFPGTSTAPPMTTTSLALKNVSGSVAAAMARLVRGPIATMVIVSASFSRRSRNISS